MLFFNANFICYYFYPTKKREEPKIYELKKQQFYTRKRVKLLFLFVHFPTKSHIPAFSSLQRKAC